MLAQGPVAAQNVTSLRLSSTTPSQSLSMPSQISATAFPSSVVQESASIRNT